MEPLPAPFQECGWVTQNAINTAECDELLARMDSCAGRLIDAAEDGVRRVVERYSFDDALLAETLCERLKCTVPDRWSVKEYDEHLGPFAEGEWVFSGIHPRIQQYRYTEGGVFTRHRDGVNYFSVDERSFFTILVYLNDAYTGGRTTVFDDRTDASHAVECETGTAFAMLQRVLHEGAPVLTGTKLALRCDVMYTRDPAGPSAVSTLATLPREEKAKRWFALGSALEDSDLSEQAWPCYRTAFKLDPSLEGSPNE